MRLLRFPFATRRASAHRNDKERRLHLFTLADRLSLYNLALVYLFRAMGNSTKKEAPFPGLLLV